MREQTIEKRAYAVIKGEDYAPMIKFYRETGDVVALAYAYLMGVDLNKSGLLTLFFTAHRVKIRGQSLGELLDDLARHQVISVYEREFSTTRPPLGECTVDEIKIESV